MLDLILACNALLNVSSLYSRSNDPIRSSVLSVKAERLASASHITPACRLSPVMSRFISQKPVTSPVGFRSVVMLCSTEHTSPDFCWQTVRPRYGSEEGAACARGSQSNSPADCPTRSPGVQPDNRA